MSSSDAIGGYLELELNNSKPLHADAIKLNSGRNCFEYILAAHEVKKVYLPKYTCDAMLEPLQKLKVPYEFYSINKDLELTAPISLSDNEFIVYNNYFGVKDRYAEKVAGIYQDKLILDNSQAYYSLPLAGIHTFYSPRKFFGVPDGGLLFTNKQTLDELPVAKSYQRFSHLIKRIDEGAESAYADFQSNDQSLSNGPLMKMSVLTEKLLRNINYHDAKTKRTANFHYLHDHLKSTNKLFIDSDASNAALCYPFLCAEDDLRQKLIQNKIFVPIYWKNVLESCASEDIEYHIAKNLIALPIDQRYGKEEMCRILEIIHG